MESVEDIEKINNLNNPTNNFINKYNTFTQKNLNNADTLFKSLSDLVIKKLDRKFILDNRDIKDKIYSNLDSNSIFNWKYFTILCC